MTEPRQTTARADGVLVFVVIGGGAALIPFVGPAIAIGGLAFCLGWIVLGRWPAWRPTMLLACSSAAAGWLLALAWVPTPAPEPSPALEGTLEAATFARDGRWMVRCDRYAGGLRSLSRFDLTRSAEDLARADHWPDEVRVVEPGRTWSVSGDGGLESSWTAAAASATVGDQQALLLRSGRLFFGEKDVTAPIVEPDWEAWGGSPAWSLTPGRTLLAVISRVHSSAALVSVWDGISDEPLLTVAPEAAVTASALGDGWLALASASSLKLVSVPDGGETELPLAGVQAIDIAPGGRRIAVALAGELVVLTAPAGERGDWVLQRRPGGRGEGPPSAWTPALRMLDDQVVLGLRSDGRVFRSEGPYRSELLPLRSQARVLLPGGHVAAWRWPPPPPSRADETRRWRIALGLYAVALLAVLGDRWRRPWVVWLTPWHAIGLMAIGALAAWLLPSVIGPLSAHGLDADTIAIALAGSLAHFAMLNGVLSTWARRDHGVWFLVGLFALALALLHRP